MPCPVYLRLMEGLVEEEIAGLGECLSMCAGRSRTLKLLGFQHLHYDARLQGFLETRANTVLRPLITDAFLLARSFLGLREAARQGALWRRLVSHQQEKRQAAKQLARVVEEHCQQRRVVKEHVTRLLNSQTEEFLIFSLSEWARVAQRAMFERCMSRLEQLSEEHELQRSEKEALREKHVRERLQKYSSLLGQMQGTCFAAWKAAAEDGRLRERRQQRLKMSFFNQTTALLESVVQTWFQVARDHRITRRRQEMLRDKKLREVTRILLTGMLHGAELFCILEAWHQMVQERRSGEEKKLKAQKVISQLASDQLGMAFTGWCAACKAQRAAEAQRFQAVQKTVLVGLQATVGVVWAAWAKGLAKRKRKQQLLQHLSASSEQSLQLAFGAWWRHCNVSKARHSRRSSAAERAVLKSLRGILSESFTEWKDLTRSERLHVLGGQLARAKGNVKALSALKLKTVLQQESGCMCRILMCWQLWTSEQLAIQKERRRLARTAGLGRSSAIRLQCRLTQQRVMLAWLMMSKLRPTAEKPGTFIVKSLPEPQARLALPSPVQVVTSVEAIDEPPQAVTFEVERSPKDSPESAAAAAAAAAWLQASEAPSPSRFRVTTSPTRASERYTLASKAATNDGDYRQLLEHHRREIREQREAARRSSPERVQQWGVWAK